MGLTEVQEFIFYCVEKVIMAAELAHKVGWMVHDGQHFALCTLIPRWS